MSQYTYITLRDRPQLKERAAAWFHSKWEVPQEAYLNNETDYGWYLCLDEDKIVGCLGVIENDFHNRKDLTPNVCAVYTEKEYRCKGIAGHLLDIVVDDMKSKVITPIYLITDHTSSYVRITLIPHRNLFHLLKKNGSRFQRWKRNASPYTTVTAIKRAEN